MLKEAVLSKPEFEKVASVNLPKDASKWVEAITNSFYNTISFLPAGSTVDIRISNAEAGRGYAKGSVVVKNDSKHINFPIIIKDFSLYPFDTVYATNDDGELAYAYASERIIKRLLSNYDSGSLYFGNSKGVISGVKRPGGSNEKEYTDIGCGGGSEKVASIAMIGATKDDIEKISSQLNDPSVKASFASSNISVDDIVSKMTPIEKTAQDATTIRDLISTRKKPVVADFEINPLSPIKEAISPSNLGTVRFQSVPNMSLLNGTTAAEKINLLKNGYPRSGIILNAIDIEDLEKQLSDRASNTYSSELKNLFISPDSKTYMTRRCRKDRKYLYGEQITNHNFEADRRMIDAAIDSITQDGITGVKDTESGIMKNFTNIRQLNPQNADYVAGSASGPIDERYNEDKPYNRNAGRIIAIYGSDGKYFAVDIGKFENGCLVNGQYVIKTNRGAFFPSAIKTITKFSENNDPAILLTLDSRGRNYAIPKTSKFFDCSSYSNIDDDELVISRDVTNDRLEEIKTDACNGTGCAESPCVEKCASAIGVFPSVSIHLNRDSGFSIIGSPIEKLASLLHMDTVHGGITVSAGDAVSVLGAVGIEKSAAARYLKKSLLKHAQGYNPTVNIYNVNDDFIVEKKASSAYNDSKLQEYREGAANQLRTNMIKEASILNDPDAVDVVLSLNFINSDNLEGYIENIDEIKGVSDKLASMLIASRMGLAYFDDGALKSALKGLETVIDGLEKLKIALGTK